MAHSEEPPGPVIGVGASAGGVEALSGLVRRLPGDLAVPVLVVLHVSPAGTSVLRDILARTTSLEVVTAVHGERARPGTIHVAPPDQHLELHRGHLLALSRGPRVNGHRPAIDPLLSSLAEACGPAATGVLLSGTLDDGSRGLFELQAAGGAAYVQDPEEARHPGMIRSALRTTPVDGILPLAELAAALVARAAGEVPGDRDEAAPAPLDDRISPTRYTCPDCGGVLWRHAVGSSVSYRCSVGHAYGPATLEGEQRRSTEVALWAAARVLGDRRELLSELADRAEVGGRRRGAAQFRENAAEMASAAAVITELIERGRVAPPPGPERPE